MNKIKYFFNKKPELYKNLFIIVIYLLLPYLFFKNTSTINNFFYGQGDALIQNFPFRHLLIQSFKNLEFPLWNPYNFSGMPLFADIQVGGLYLLNIVIGLIFPSSLLAFNFSTFLHYSLAGIFTFYLAKEYKLSKISSFVAGMIFMFGGFMIIRKSHSQMLYAAIWLPLILFLIERYRETKKIKYIIFSSFALTIQFFAGNTQLFFYSSIVVFFYIIFLFLKSDASENYKQRLYIFNCLWIFLLFFLLSLIQLIPTYELLKLSLREKLDYQSFTLFSFNPKNIPLFFFPYLFGKINPENLKNISTFFKDNYIESAMFLGFFPISLALTGFFKKNKYKLFWGFILLASLLLVFGKYIPSYNMTFHIPVYNSFRIPSRHWYEFSFSLALLAGFGFDYIYNNFKDKKFKKCITITIIFISLLFLTFLAFYIYFHYSVKSGDATFFGYNAKDLRETISFNKPTVYIPLVFIGICIALFILVTFFKKSFLKFKMVFFIFFIIFIFLELFSFGYDFEPFINRDIQPLINKDKYSSSIKFLKEDKELFRIYPVYYPTSASTDPINNSYFNLNIFYNLHSIVGNNPLILKEYFYFTYLNQEGINGDANGFIKNNNILSALNVKYVLMPNQDYDPENTDKIFVNKSFVLSESLINFDEIINNSNINSFTFDKNTNSIIISSKDESLKVLQFPISLKKSKDYLIKFKIKKISNSISSNKKSADKNIHFDFYGKNYDNIKQEVVIETEDLKENFEGMEFLINSSEITSKSDTFFRIFLWKSGEYVVKDLTVKEVLEEKPYSDYKKLKIFSEPYIYYNKKFLPRFYFIENIIKINSIEDAKDNFLNKEFSPFISATVENYSVKETNFKNYQDNKYEIISYKNNSVSLKVDMQENGFLVFSDTFYPGWKAYVDKRITKIYKTDGVLKGIYIPKGIHEIKFLFMPTSFLIGLIISTLTFILLIALLVVLKKLNK